MKHKPTRQFSWATLATLSMVLFHAEVYAEDSIARGAKLWMNNCARCHNPRPPSEFNDQKWQTIMQHMRIQGGLSGEESREILTYIAPQYAPTSNTETKTKNAENTATPDESKKTPAQEKPAAAIAPADQTLAKTEKTVSIASNTQNIPQPNEKKTDKPSGSDIYHKTCVSCHGSNGKGAIPGVPDFTQSNSLSNSESVLLEHIKNGYQKPGDPMAMPAKGGNPSLTDDDIKQVLEYIQKTFKH